jgi:hypothetical protein
MRAALKKAIPTLPAPWQMLPAMPRAQPKAARAKARTAAKLANAALATVMAVTVANVQGVAIAAMLRPALAQRKAMQAKKSSTWFVRLTLASPLQRLPRRLLRKWHLPKHLSKHLRWRKPCPWLPSQNPLPQHRRR